jgi:hemerythrin
MNRQRWHLRTLATLRNTLICLKLEGSHRKCKPSRSLAMKAHAAKPNRPRTLVTALRHARQTLCHRLHALLDAPDAALVRDFAPLVAEVEAGFRHEELIMGTLGYERLREQRAENAVVLAALHRVLPQVEDGDAALARQVLTALLDVLDLHRLSTGVALAVAVQPPALRARGSAARLTQRVGMRGRHPR